MKKYCYNCDCEQETKVIRKKESFPVRGEPIEVISDVLVCDACQEELFDSELDEANLERAFNEYRKKYNLLSPSDIRELRSRFGSGRLVATLLGWSQATLVRYENGAIPNKAHHDQLLQLRDDPNYVKRLLSQNGDKLSERELIKLTKLIEQDLSHRETQSFDPVEELNKMFRAFLKDGIVDTEFDFEKLANAVIFFAYHDRLVKTKLQKLLFYADFLSTKRYGKQIVGMPYVHHHYGPVPYNHEFVHSCLLMSNIIDTVPLEGPYGREIITPSNPPNLSVFTTEELDILTTVLEYFKGFSATQISEFSHKEKGYLETPHKEIIPYLYSEHLLLN
ncbi:type II TA system antitoxin MqsA family protein [Desulfosporosinus sp. BG]|uniref:type II TA system antitoxin MqsA family protein n=1 Tax=Desulfosporosinus sp. BG TaxID=1633135 RepID=UPI00083A0E07|nr:type II TA system antitoxin MqsA family protein [Desulfosporosinus sp. BG]ODA39170.1 Prophage ps3 protein 01 [Desulfosporosinus sp. BG]